jgi:hypothetical protein
MKRILVVYLVLLSSLALISACTNDTGSTSVNNKLMQLQKEIPFKIILPKYLPPEFNGTSPKMDIHEDPFDKVKHLTIYYYAKDSPEELFFNESIPQEILPDETLAKIFFEDTPIELAGKTVFEHVGISNVIRSNQKIKLPSCSYFWNNNGVHFVAEVSGYDQTESRNIIESMIK